MLSKNTSQVHLVRLSVTGLALVNLLAGSVSAADACTAANSTAIPKLPPVGGVTLSGMDFASNPASLSLEHNSSAVKITRKDKNITTSEDREINGSFTLPSYDQLIHYLDGNVSMVKLPVAWESIQDTPFAYHTNTTNLEDYMDVVATVTSRNVSVILSISASAERFETLNLNKTSLNSDKTLQTGSNKTTESDDSPDRKIPSRAFVKMWGQLAKKFKDDRRVIFHLMSRPDNTTVPKDWNDTIQSAVTLIRKNGASNLILLPSTAKLDGSTFSSFRNFAKEYAYLKDIQNPDNTTNGLLFDLVQTFGPRNGTGSTCMAVNSTAIIKPVVELLKNASRQALVGTLAGGSEPSCITALTSFSRQVSLSYPHIAGFVMYGAGAFNSNSSWALVKPGANSTACKETWDDQPNFNAVKPYLPHNKRRVLSVPQ